MKIQQIHNIPHCINYDLKAILGHLYQQFLILNLENHFQPSSKHFQETIPTLIPDYSDKIATKIRDFAIGQGINPEALDTITDPGIVKFVDDFRRLKESTTKGAAKRKVTPAKKALPTKKPKTSQKKATDRANTVRAKAFAKDSSKSDQDAFLKQLASKSLNL